MLWAAKPGALVPRSIIKVRRESADRYIARGESFGAPLQPPQWWNCSSVSAARTCPLIARRANSFDASGLESHRRIGEAVAVDHVSSHRGGRSRAAPPLHNAPKALEGQERQHFPARRRAAQPPAEWFPGMLMTVFSVYFVCSLLPLVVLALQSAAHAQKAERSRKQDSAPPTEVCKLQ